RDRSGVWYSPVASLPEPPEPGDGDECGDATVSFDHGFSQFIHPAEFELESGSEGSPQLFDIEIDKFTILDERDYELTFVTTATPVRVELWSANLGMLFQHTKNATSSDVFSLEAWDEVWVQVYSSNDGSPLAL